jgi:hypothetical protein
MKLGVVAMLGLALVWGAQAGCSTKTCTLVGCPFAFEVFFDTPGGLWAQGNYDVAVTADGRSGRCVVSLPFASCAGPPPSCEGERDWQLILSGCALPAEKHGIGGITFGVGSSPATVEVTIARGDERLAKTVFTPRYESSQPNGPGCGDTCYSAPSATLSVLP